MESRRIEEGGRKALYVIWLLGAWTALVIEYENE